MSAFTNESECCICLEMIGEKNNCTTQCGHSFCFSCVTRSLVNNNTCPMCRSVLVESKEEDEDDDDDDDYDIDDEDDEDEDVVIEDDDNIEEITERFLKLGYTAMDIMSLLTGRYKRSDPKYTDEYINKMVEVFEKIVDDADDEKNEMELMGREDSITTV